MAVILIASVWHPEGYARRMSLSTRLLGTPESVPHAEAQRRGQRGVAIYWRPGCSFCQMLRLRLRSVADRAAWVNVWEDREASAWVRSVNQGNEVVPTVLIDGVPHTNPSPGMVLRRLSADS